jgi:hypothetical protein
VKNNAEYYEIVFTGCGEISDLVKDTNLDTNKILRVQLKRSHMKILKNVFNAGIQFIKI